MSLRKMPNLASFCVLSSIVSFSSDLSIFVSFCIRCRFERSAIPISLLLDRLTSSSLVFPHRSCLVKLLIPPPKSLVGRMRLIAESEAVSPKCGLIFY